MCNTLPSSEYTGYRVTKTNAVFLNIKAESDYLYGHIHMLQAAMIFKNCKPHFITLLRVRR